MNDYIISVNVNMLPIIVKFDSAPDAMRFMASIQEKKHVDLNFIIQNNRIIQSEFDVIGENDVEDFIDTNG